MVKINIYNCNIGFSEVKKQKSRTTNRAEEQEDETNQPQKEHRLQNKHGHGGPRAPRREGERMFERHSGTGRGYFQ